MSVFKAYDIRGIYGKDLTDEMTEKISKAFVNLLNVKKIVIGTDVRKSSPKLKGAVIKGLVSQGCKIIDIGLVPVPMFYYTILKHKIKGGIYITASHDPPKYNGLKLCKAKDIDLTYESGIHMLEKTYNKKYPTKKGGKIVKKNIENDYKKQLLKKIKLKRPLHVVIDAGNGCWSKTAPEVFKKLGCKVTKLFCKFDGTFPNRSPEPTKASLKKLKNTVKKVKADLGIAFDTDGDRAVFVDEQGKFIQPDLVLLFFARNLLKKNNKLIADIRSTKILENEAKKNKWKLIWSRIGRSYIKQKMIKNKITLGGEFSGHYYFKKNNYYDDGLFSSLIFTELLTKKNKTVSSLISELPNNPSIHSRIRCDDEKKFKIIKKLKELFKNYRLVLIDGVGIKFKSGFALVRASNTEPKIEVSIEANNRSALKKIKRNVLNKVKIAMKTV